MFFVCQGHILSKALKAQKDAEEESTQISFGNLHSEVITLQNDALEKDKILVSLVERLKSSETRMASHSEVEQKMEKFKKKQEADEKRIADLEYALSIQVELHHPKCKDLRRSLMRSMKTLMSNKRNMRYLILSVWQFRKMLKSFITEKRNATMLLWNVAISWKNSFAKVGAFYTEQNFICGDPDRVIRWISGETEAFDLILSDRGDFCTFTGAQCVISLLEKAGCEHAKDVIQPEFSVSASDIKDPSVEATALSRKFYSEVWLVSGGEIANKTIRQNEKGSHTSLEEARKAEESAERERHIGIFVVI
jgi:hypothetical protein